MKKKTFRWLPGKLLCGVSFALVLSAAGQDDPFTNEGDTGGGGSDGSGWAESDPFADGGSDDPFADPFAPRIFRKGKASEILKNQQDQVAVMIEMIEVDHLTANEMVLAFSKQANNAKQMRNELIEMVKDGDAKLMETLWGRSPLNEVSKVEAVVEKIYPTEYEPPELPQFVTGGIGEKKEKGASTTTTVQVKGDLYTSAAPTTFDTRNVGTTFEFEAAESAEHPGEIGISIYLQLTQFLQYDQFLAEGFEKEARGTSNIVMPRFSNITKEFVATVKPGHHSLLGVFKSGKDETEPKQVVILMHVEMIAKE